MRTLPAFVFVCSFAMLSAAPCSGTEDYAVQSLAGGSAPSTKMWCNALRSAIDDDDAPRLQSLVSQPAVQTLLATTTTMLNGSQKTLANALIFDGVEHHKSTDLLTVLLKSAIAATSDLKEVQEMLEAVSKAGEGTSQVLSIIANDQSLVNTIIANAGGKQARAGNNCLQLLSSSLSSAPLYLQLGCKGLAYAVKGSRAIFRGTSSYLQRVKNGTAVTSHNKHNAAHVAILHGSSKLLAWCIINCRPEVLEQRNAQNYTPLEFALCRINVMTYQKQEYDKRRQTGFHPFLDRYAKRKQRQIDKMQTMCDMLRAAVALRNKIDAARMQHHMPLSSTPSILSAVPSIADTDDIRCDSDILTRSSRASSLSSCLSASSASPSHRHNLREGSAVDLPSSPADDDEDDELTRLLC